MAEKSITEILEGAKNATIIAVDQNGKKYVSFDDYVNLTTAQALENKPGLGVPPLNPDGSPAGTTCEYVAVSMDQLFLNRYKVVDDKLYVCTDWWSINASQTGRMPLPRVPVFVIGRDGKKLVYEKTTTVSDNEFLSDFTRILDREAMAQILPLLAEKERGITEDKLPI